MNIGHAMIMIQSYCTKDYENLQGMSSINLYFSRVEKALFRLAWRFPYAVQEGKLIRLLKI